MTRWRRALTIGLPVLLVLAVLSIVLIRTTRRAGPGGGAPVALALVETTTLSILSGQVQIKPASAGPTGAYVPAVNGQTLVVGDTVKTLANAHALITYFEGSTTEIEPDSEFVIQKLDKDPAGIKTEISGKLVVGNTWSKVVRLLDPSSHFDIETPSAVAVVRGTEFGVQVAPTGETAVTATQGEVVAQAAGVAVPVAAGQATTIQPGQPPEPPRPAPPPTRGLRLTLASPASLYICDNVGRCTGLLPVGGLAQGVPVNQIPGAYYSGPDAEPQLLVLPEPLQNYTVVFAALGNGGTYHFEVAGIGNGEVHSEQAYAGVIGKGTKQQTGFSVDVDPDGHVLVSGIAEPETIGGPPPGVLILARGLLTPVPSGTAGATVQALIAQRTAQAQATYQALGGTPTPPLSGIPTPNVGLLRQLSPEQARQTPRPTPPPTPAVPTVPPALATALAQGGPAPAGGGGESAPPPVVQTVVAQLQATAIIQATLTPLPTSTLPLPTPSLPPTPSPTVAATPTLPPSPTALPTATVIPSPTPLPTETVVPSPTLPLPSPTPPPTATPPLPSPTLPLPSPTAVLPTPTVAVPTATALPPTSTPVPPTATPLPPTSTPLPPTATPIPPTAVPPTETPAPPTATGTNTATVTPSPTITATPTPAGNTPPGTNVTVTGPNGASLTFSAVTSAGMTTITTTTTSPLPAPPLAATPLGLYYQVSTTAAFSGPAKVCLPTTGLSLPAGITTADLLLLHGEPSGLWAAPAGQQVTGTQICAPVPVLSPFVIAAPSTPMLAGQAPGAVVLFPEPATTSAGFGSIFPVVVRLDSGSQPVDSAQFALQYDPTLFDVVDASGIVLTTNPATPGTALPTVLQNQLDTTAGVVRFAAGVAVTSGGAGPAPSGSFVLATVRFRLRVPPAGSAGTLLAFDPLGTQAFYQGTDVLAGTGGVIWPALVVPPGTTSVPPTATPVSVQATPTPLPPTPTLVLPTPSPGPVTLSCSSSAWGAFSALCGPPPIATPAYSLSYTNGQAVIAIATPSFGLSFAVGTPVPAGSDQVFTLVAQQTGGASGTVPGQGPGVTLSVQNPNAGNAGLEVRVQPAPGFFQVLQQVPQSSGGFSVQTLASGPVPFSVLPAGAPFELKVAVTGGCQAPAVSVWINGHPMARVAAPVYSGGTVFIGAQSSPQGGATFALTSFTIERPGGLSIGGATGLQAAIYPTGGIQLWRNATPNVYGGDDPASGFVLQADGTRIGTQSVSGWATVDRIFTFVSSCATAVDTMVSTFRDSTSGITVTQTAQWSSADNALHLRWDVQSPAVVSTLRFFHAADTYVDGNDYGTGSYDSSTGTVGVNSVVILGRTMFLRPVSPAASHYQESYYGTGWSAISSGRLSDTINTSSHDAWMGLEWDTSLAASGTFTVQETWGFIEPPSSSSLSAQSSLPSRTPGPSPTMKSRYPATPIASATPTPAATATTTPTAAATPMATSTPGATATTTATATATATATPAATAAAPTTSTPTTTATVAASATTMTTATVTPTATPAATVTPTPVPTVSPTATATPAPTATVIPVPAPTTTPRATATP